jgi:hypothetical protein
MAYRVRQRRTMQDQKFYNRFEVSPGGRAQEIAISASLDSTCPAVKPAYR